MTSLTRRERLRTATVAEIKDLARRQLVTGGPTAISLRAIARDMGMTAPAIYRYFPSLDALIAALVDDLIDELCQCVQAARDSSAEDDPASQMMEMARAFRRWCLAHPAEFTLMFGAPVPGVTPWHDAVEHEEHAGARLGGLFLDAIMRLRGDRPFRTPPAALIEETLQQGLKDCVSLHDRDVPADVLYAFFAGWARLYGLVAMEVFGHAPWVIVDMQPLFELELASFLAQITARQ